jgi:C-terminal processing protease CtpA/Prc
MHGIDWEQMGKDYMPKVKGINNNRDFAILASELLGELNSSHTGGRYQGRPPAHANTASLGAIYGAEPQKNGLLIEEILPKSPLKKSTANIEAGMILTHIDGQAVNASSNLYSQLNGKANKRVRLTLKNGNKSFETVIRPTSIRNEGQALYERWVESRRDYVEKISGGRIGYVHVRQMNDASFRQVYADLFGKHFETEAVVVDTRFNGGGWLHDDLVVLLGGKQYTKMLPRGREYQGDPIERWTKPSIVLMNEGNYSDGYIFPVAYKANGIGKTIGMPVPGTGTPVWWERLHTDDIVFGIPQIAVTDMQGNVMENNQLEPDILINNLPEEVAKGDDPQLKRAVEELLK